jgi:hypothetical protein
MTERDHHTGDDRKTILALVCDQDAKMVRFTLIDG